MSSDQMRKTFLLGSIVLGVLVVFGLVWAIASGPGPAGSTQFDDANAPAKGAETDKVVRIFGDFQCPACRAAEPAVRQMIAKYSGQVRFLWNDFPLVSIHPNAMPAANAARCAEAQGKFWEMHDKLYDEQPNWDSISNPRQKFLDYANALGLDAVAFASCYDGRDHQSKISADLSEGNRIGVSATPTFYVGDQKLEGGVSAAGWESAIRTLLSQPSASTTTP